jgi:hypothetical protein
MPINLHEKFNHYLNSDRKLDLEDINERIISYGWTDDGMELTGYRITTENYILYYNLSDEFVRQESRWFHVPSNHKPAASELDQERREFLKELLQPTDDNV